MDILYFHGYLFISVDISLFPWIFIDIRGDLFISMNIYLFPWIFIDIRGYLFMYIYFRGDLFIYIYIRGRKSEIDAAQDRLASLRGVVYQA